MTRPTTDNLVLHHCEVADLRQYVVAESVDWIFTDPPYPREYVARELARLCRARSPAAASRTTCRVLDADAQWQPFNTTEVTTKANMVSALPQP